MSKTMVVNQEAVELNFVGRLKKRYEELLKKMRRNSMKNRRHRDKTGSWDMSLFKENDELTLQVSRIVVEIRHLSGLKLDIKDLSRQGLIK